MVFLILASVLWSLSFALIKSSGIDPDLLSAARLGLAALVFLPLLARQPAPRALASKLAFIGSIQFGLMYVLVMRSYDYLAGFEVALLTVTTPILVVLFEAALARRVTLRPLLAACIAVVAALVLRWPAQATRARYPSRASPWWAGPTRLGLSVRSSIVDCFGAAPRKRPATPWPTLAGCTWAPSPLRARGHCCM